MTTTRNIAAAKPATKTSKGRITRANAKAKRTEDERYRRALGLTKEEARVALLPIDDSDGTPARAEVPLWTYAYSDIHPGSRLGRLISAAVALGCESRTQSETDRARRHLLHEVASFCEVPLRNPNPRERAKVEAMMANKYGDHCEAASTKKTSKKAKVAA